MGLLIIENGYVVTMDDERRIIEKGSVVVEDERIIDVGKTSRIRAKGYQPDQVIDATRKVIMPGLVNTHTHLYQILLRCMGDDTDLIRWIREKIRMVPHIAYLTPQDMYAAAATGLIEAIRSGTTTTHEMQYVSSSPQLTEEVFKAARDVGSRAVISKSQYDIDRFNYVPESLGSTMLSLEEGVKQFKAMHAKWHGACNGRLYSWGGPDWPPACSEEALSVYADLALELGTKFPFHLAESREESTTFEKRMGELETAWLHENCPRMGEVLIAVHSIWLSEADLEILAKTGTPVSHNTTSNCYLGDGLAPVPRMRSKGVTVSLGVDGAASNCTQDLWEMLKWTALVHKVAACDPTMMRAEDVLEMATIQGARALGLDQEIGSLAPGKKADLILVDLSGINYSPLNRLISQLVYCGSGRDVDTVLVNGEIVLENKRMTRVDEDRIKRQVQRRSDQLLRRAGTQDERRRPGSLVP